MIGVELLLSLPVAQANEDADCSDVPLAVVVDVFVFITAAAACPFLEIYLKRLEKNQKLKYYYIFRRLRKAKDLICFLLLLLLLLARHQMI